MSGIDYDVIIKSLLVNIGLKDDFNIKNGIPLYYVTDKYPENYIRIINFFTNYDVEKKNETLFKNIKKIMNKLEIQKGYIMGKTIGKTYEIINSSINKKKVTITDPLTGNKISLYVFDELYGEIVKKISSGKSPPISFYIKVNKIYYKYHNKYTFSDFIAEIITGILNNNEYYIKIRTLLNKNKAKTFQSSIIKLSKPGAIKAKAETINVKKEDAINVIVKEFVKATDNIQNMSKIEDKEELIFIDEVKAPQIPITADDLNMPIIQPGNNDEIYNKEPEIKKEISEKPEEIDEIPEEVYKNMATRLVEYFSAKLSPFMPNTINNLNIQLSGIREMGSTAKNMFEGISVYEVIANNKTIIQHFLIGFSAIAIEYISNYIFDILYSIFHGLYDIPYYITTTLFYSTTEGDNIITDIDMTEIFRDSIKDVKTKIIYVLDDDENENDSINNDILPPTPSPSPSSSNNEIIEIAENLDEEGFIKMILNNLNDKIRLIINIISKSFNYTVFNIGKISYGLIKEFFKINYDDIYKSIIETTKLGLTTLTQISSLTYEISGHIVNYIARFTTTPIKILLFATIPYVFKVITTIFYKLGLITYDTYETYVKSVDRYTKSVIDLATNTVNTASEIIETGSSLLSYGGTIIIGVIALYVISNVYQTIK